MNNRIFFILLFFSGIHLSVSGQYNFVVQNNGTSVFTTIQEAYDNASAGDTIYLPGGSFNFPTVDKPLVWIGVGYHPDSTTATHYTRINNEALFRGNCDGSFVTGIHFASNVRIGVSEDDAEDFQLFRCRITGSLNLKYDDNQERVVNMKVSECILDNSINAYQGSNILIEKCVITGTLNEFVNSVFDRVIILNGTRNYYSGYSYAFTNTKNSLIMNSIFNYQSYVNWKMDVYGNINNNLINNIMAGRITFPDGTNTGSNNITETDLSTVFEYIDENISIFSYLHDFHLKEGSPGIGAGVAGTDIGIFGGSSPFKEGGLPFNPHIRSIQIPVESTNGYLPVIIEVGAQTN